VSDDAEGLIPHIRRDDDIYLVSFPKSGNTWLSFIIANMMVEKLELGFRVNHFNLHGFTPDIHQGQDIPADLGYFPFKRFIKSHAGFHPDYKNLIYLVRDPRSVMVSYHIFLTKLGFIDMSLSEFIHNPSLGIISWVQHVDDWMNKTIPGTRIRVFRYEDMLSDVEASIEEIAFLIGCKLTSEQVGRIAEHCSFAEMKALEKTTGSLATLRHDKSFTFLRQGLSSGWKEEISSDDLAYIETVSQHWMSHFSYA